MGKTENKNIEDLRCHTIHLFYKIEGSEIFFYKDGYAQKQGHMATNMLSLEDDQEIGESGRIHFAKFCEVPLENVTRISRDEYLENTKNGDEIIKRSEV